MTLTGVKLYPRIGVASEERSVPQECSADLTLWGNFEAAASSDDIDRSIDYCEILATMQKIAGSREYCLLETLAYAIVRHVLQAFPIVRARIKVRKRPAVLLKEMDFVEVEVEES